MLLHLRTFVFVMEKQLQISRLLQTVNALKTENARLKGTAMVNTLGSFAQLCLFALFVVY